MIQQYKYKNEALGKLCFPDYENFSDVSKAYENVIQKLMSVVDKLAPFKIRDRERDRERQRETEREREYFENKLKENIATPKDLWKTIKSFGLSKKFSVVQTNAIVHNKRLKYDLLT